jgi:hypothetical protein
VRIFRGKLGFVRRIMGKLRKQRRIRELLFERRKLGIQRR